MKWLERIMYVLAAVMAAAVLVIVGIGVRGIWLIMPAGSRRVGAILGIVLGTILITYFLYRWVRKSWTSGSWRKYWSWRKKPPSVATTTTLPARQVTRPSWPWKVIAVMAVVVIGAASLSFVMSSTSGAGDSSYLTTVVGWVLVALLVTALGFALYAAINKLFATRTRTTPATPAPAQQPGQAATTPQTNTRSISKIVWTGIGAVWTLIAIVVTLGIAYTIAGLFFGWGPSKAVEKAEEIPVTIPERLIDREWSDEIGVPYGYQVVFRPKTNVAFQVKNQRGKVFQYHRDPKFDTRLPDEPRICLPGKLESFKLRVTDSEVGAASFEISVAKNLGLKCGWTAAEVTEVPNPPAPLNSTPLAPLVPLVPPLNATPIAPPPPELPETPTLPSTPFFPGTLAPRVVPA